MENKVSIIIPYKIDRLEQLEHLREAIDSALNQTYSNIEIIVIDDNHRNYEYNSYEEDFKFNLHAINSLVDSLDRIIFLKKNNKIIYLMANSYGVSAARNQGIIRASGEYILCLDHDDILEPFAVEKMVAELNKGKFDIIGSWFTEFWDDMPQKRLKLRKFDTDSNRFLIIHGLSVTSLFRKRDWEKCGGFTTDKSCKIEDTEFFLRMIRINNSKIKVIPESLFLYRKYKKYKSRNSALSKEEINKMIKMMNFNNIEVFQRKVLFLVKQGKIYFDEAELLKKQNKRLKKKWKIGLFSLGLNLVLATLLIIKIL